MIDLQRKVTMLPVSDLNSQMLGGLGWRELILMAAIVLLLAGADRLTGFSREKSHRKAERASSRAYLDRLLGPARSRLGSLVVENPATAQRKLQT